MLGMHYPYMCMYVCTMMNMYIYSMSEYVVNHIRILLILCVSLKPPPNKLMVTTTHLSIMFPLICTFIRVCITKLN